MYIGVCIGEGQQGLVITIDWPRVMNYISYCFIALRIFPNFYHVKEGI